MMNQPQPQYGGSFPQQQQQQKGCWGRNWKWLVPTGCLGLLLLVVALVVGIFFIAMSAVKSSDVYQSALNKAKSDPSVIEELGEPIKDGWLIRGSVETSGDGGHASFQIPISGPKKSGTIYAEASKAMATRGGSDWHYTTLEVEVEGRPERIALTGEDSSPPQPTEDGDSGDTDDIEPPPPPMPPGESGETPTQSGGKTISGGVLDGKAISKPEPSYPAIGKAVKAAGKVVVQVVVDESGNVISASAVSGHPLLQSAAVQAARQAKFAPTKLGGVAVKVTGILTYNFVLE